MVGVLEVEVGVVVADRVDAGGQRELAELLGVAREGAAQQRLAVLAQRVGDADARLDGAPAEAAGVVALEVDRRQQALGFRDAGVEAARFFMYWRS